MALATSTSIVSFVRWSPLVFGGILDSSGVPDEFQVRKFAYPAAGQPGNPSECRPVASPPMIGAVPEAGTSPPTPDSDVDPDVDPGAGFQRPSAKWPALIVLGIAVLIVIVGLVGSAISSTGKAPTSTVHQVTLSDGTTMSLTPAATALHSLVADGQPPADIMGNLAVPTGSRVTGTVNSDQSAGQFDRTVDFATSVTGDEIVDAYKALLPKLGWQVLYVGAGVRNAKSGTEVLAKRGSSDGYYWEVGVVVSPATAAGTTPFSVEVFELSDDD